MLLNLAQRGGFISFRQLKKNPHIILWMSEPRSSATIPTVNAQLASTAVRTFRSKAHLDKTAEQILMGLRRKGKHTRAIKRTEEKRRKKQEGKKEKERNSFNVMYLGSMMAAPSFIIANSHNICSYAT
jgi:hypothetical protein